MIVRDFVLFCSFSVDNSYFKNTFKRNFPTYMSQIVMNSKDTTLPDVKKDSTYRTSVGNASKMYACAFVEKLENRPKMVRSA